MKIVIIVIHIMAAFLFTSFIAFNFTWFVDGGIYAMICRFIFIALCFFYAHNNDNVSMLFDILKVSSYTVSMLNN